MGELIQLDTPELQRVEASKAAQIRETFGPIADAVAAVEARYQEVMAAAASEVTPELSAQARRLRLDIREMRLRAEASRKALKRDYLIASQAIDGTAAIVKWAISAKEDKLREIEEHAARDEERRIAALQAERAEALAPYVDDAAERELGTMADDVWATYIAAKRRDHEERIEAERRAEAERKERERIAAIQRERERELLPLREHAGDVDLSALGTMAPEAYVTTLAAARERKAAHDAEQVEIRAEKERLEAEAAKEARARARERKRLEREAAEERRQREAIEARERERVEAEQRAEAERKRAEAEAAAAPVRERLVAWVDAFALPPLPGEPHAVAAEIVQSWERWREGVRRQAEAADA